MMYSFLVNVNVMPLGVLEELLSTFDERDSRGTILAEIDVEDSSSLENFYEVLMSCPSREAGEVKGSLLMTWKGLAAAVTF